MSLIASCESCSAMVFAMSDMSSPRQCRLNDRIVMQTGVAPRFVNSNVRIEVVNYPCPTPHCADDEGLPHLQNSIWSQPTFTQFSARFVIAIREITPVHVEYIACCISSTVAASHLPRKLSQLSREGTILLSLFHNQCALWTSWMHRLLGQPKLAKNQSR